MGDQKQKSRVSGKENIKIFATKILLTIDSQNATPSLYPEIYVTFFSVCNKNNYMSGLSGSGRLTRAVNGIVSRLRFSRMLSDPQLPES